MGLCQTRAVPDYASFARNDYSQNGEDGIIEALLDQLPERNRWCVEFGAWDGEHLSNCANLIRNHDYSAVLIEASPERFRDLQATWQKNPRVTGLNAFVGFRPDDNLDVLLAGTAVPNDPDIISIDIDGNDYHVWAATTKLRPKIVCVEFNPTIPNAVEFVQAANPLVHQGNGVASLVKLGREKRYELVCCSSLNAFFVDAAYFELFQIEDNSLDDAAARRRNDDLPVRRLRRPCLLGRESNVVLAFDADRGATRSASASVPPAIPRRVFARPATRVPVLSAAATTSSRAPALIHRAPTSRDRPNGWVHPWSAEGKLNAPGRPSAIVRQPLLTTSLCVERPFRLRSLLGHTRDVVKRSLARVAGCRTNA